MLPPAQQGGDACASSRRRRVGGATVTALLDSEGPFFLPLSEAFPSVDPEVLERAERLDPDPRPSADRWWLAFRVYVVEAAGRLVLVDTGAASDTALHSSWAPEGAAPRRRLADELGIEADRVTDVVLTHLHGDHAAGSIDAEGRPAFPRATYHLQAASSTPYARPARRASSGGTCSNP